MSTSSAFPYEHSLTTSRFGFVKYHNYEDAENCIRGFYYLGYEVSFARVGHSFYH